MAINSKNTYTASAEITIKGFVLKWTNYVQLNQAFETHHMFEISVSADMLPTPGMKLNDLADKLIGEEASITLKQGRDGQTMQTMLVTGIVTSVRQVKELSRAATFIISGISPTVLLSANRTSRSFTKMSLESIVSNVLKPLGLLKNAVSPAYATPIPYITQYEEDNFHFLQRLAETYGEWMYYDGNKLIFGKAGRASTAPIELSYGVNIFDLEYDITTKPMNQESRYYDYETEETYKSPSSSATIGGLGTSAQIGYSKAEKLYKDALIDLSFQGIQKESDLKQLVKLKKGEKTTRLAVLHGTTLDMDIKIGGIIKVKENIYAATDASVGAIIQDTVDYGALVVTRISHSLDARGVYKNYIIAIPQDTDFAPVDYQVMAPQAKPQPALVVDTEDDKKIGRIKVNFFWQDGETTPWIRVANTMSATSRSYFIPEVGDTVFVDFEFCNPDLPFVVGAMYTGKTESLKPGALVSKDNNTKGIITKGGNHIIINDESGKESISIYNKDKENSIELSLDGTHITIKSTGDINLQATGDITMKAKNIMMTAEKDAKTKAQHAVMETTGGDVELIAGKELMLSAMTNTTLSATAELKASGAMVKVSADASLDLESSGVASLKGTLVKIN